MSTFLIVDANNLFFRAKHVTSGSIELKTGMALHIVFNSLKKAWRKFSATHVVFALDSKSWRSEFYPGYKGHRRTSQNLRSIKEQQEDEMFFAVMNDFVTFVQEKTNVTVIKERGLEADDIIAGWIDYHPDDNHIIVSGDSDFHQLIQPNVKIFNGITGNTISDAGVFNDQDQPLEFSVSGSSKLKIKEAREDFVPEPEWWKRALFYKILRGDPGDSIMSAYPKVRENRMAAAWEDTEHGYFWNNLMMQTWIDHEGQTVIVRDAFNRNRKLIDLREQPEEIKVLLHQTIDAATQKPVKNMVGIELMKFCGTMDLQRIASSAKDYSEFLSARYSSSVEHEA